MSREQKLRLAECVKQISDSETTETVKFKI